MARSLNSLTKSELNLLDRLATCFSRAVQRRASITTRMHQAAKARDFGAFQEARRQDAEAARECSECLTTLRVLKQLLDLEEAPEMAAALPDVPLRRGRRTTSERFLHPKP